MSGKNGTDAGHGGSAGYNGAANWETYTMWNIFAAVDPDIYARAIECARTGGAEAVKRLGWELFQENGGTFGPKSIETHAEMRLIDWEEIRVALLPE
jgi:hypothetical protein